MAGVTRPGLLAAARRPAAAWVLVGVFVLALANRLLPVLRGGGLSGVLGYDDAVYYAGAVGLVHGRLPYRDFLLLHPPGVLLALAPVAALGRWMGEVTGWEASRVVWMLMGSGTSVLVARLLLPFGRLAAAVGGCVYAVFPGAVLVERTTLLEGLTNLCLASALTLLVPRLTPLARREVGGSVSWFAPAAAGILLGFATTVKVWNVVPLMVVCIVAAAVVGVRFGIIVLSASAVTTAVVCLPFFLAAPAQMWRMVVLDQVGRSADAGVLDRAADIATMGRGPGGVLGAAVVLVAVLGLLGVCILVWRVTPLRVVVALLLSSVALLLASPAFFPHYLAVLGVPVALAAGGLVVSTAPGSGASAGRLAVTVVGCLALALDALALTRIASGEVVPTRELDPAVQSATGCITADDPSTLLALGVVGRNIDRGCDLVVDLGGYSHHLSAGTSVSRGRNQEWQLVVIRYLGGGQYALSTRFGRGRGLTPATAAAIESWPVQLRADGFELRRPS